ncbi:MAG: rhodanese-like domain-containing protein [Gemmatimonadales bacterium]|nr:rhodanese-like domain-containing protein [Gemmatimonadales bacterium]
MPNVSRISTDQLVRRLEQVSAFQFWNVLSDEYFKGELIPGSLRVPVDTVGREAGRLGLPQNAEIIVYCAGPTCPSSTQAGETLMALGYTNVKAYEGGLEEWKASGRPVAQLMASGAE